MDGENIKIRNRNLWISRSVKAYTHNTFIVSSFIYLCENSLTQSSEYLVLNNFINLSRRSVHFGYFGKD